MYSRVLGLRLAILLLYVTAQQPTASGYFKNDKNLLVLNSTQFTILASLSSIHDTKDALDKICIARAVGTPGHTTVKEYLKNSMRNLGWTVETDLFNQNTDGGIFEIENIIAKLNPDARRYLVLACHYDTKYTETELPIVGATASAVPCAQLLNLATVMQRQLKSAKSSELSLMFIFFDGQETMHPKVRGFQQYGFKHLAAKWHDNKTTYGNEIGITELDKLDTMIYLKFLGTSDTLIKYFSTNTQLWYAKFRVTEETLANLGKFDAYFIKPRYRNRMVRYFSHYPSDLRYKTLFGDNVPVFYMMSENYIFDKLNDKRKIIDMNTVENLNKILRVIVASHLRLNV